MISAMMSAKDLTKAVLESANKFNFSLYFDHYKVVEIVDRFVPHTGLR